jgi:serine protease
MFLACAVGLAAGGGEPVVEEELKVDYQSGQSPDSPLGFSADAIIVRFDADLADSERLRITLEHACWIAGLCHVGDFHLVGIPPDVSPQRMVEVFAGHENVEYAELNYYAKATFIPDDKLYPYQWNLANAVTNGIRMQEAWDIQTGDPNVIVAIIDTGVAYEDFGVYRRAPDLAGTRFVPGYDFVHSDSHPNDDQGHGTHVAGTIAQSTNNVIGVAGVAFRCSIMPIKALDEQGTGDQFTISRSIGFAIEHGARVINMSLGSTEPSTTLRNAVKLAHERGVTVVASVGNGHAKGSQPTYPAAYTEYCIGVGGVRVDLKRASYSNTGPYVSVVAPGGDLNVDQNSDGYPDGILQQTFRSDPTAFSYWFFQGTSMAAPHVSGLAALLASRGVTRPDKIREALELTARDLGPPGWDDEYGWGIVDAYAALTYHVPGDLTGDNVVDANDLVAPFVVTP